VLATSIIRAIITLMVEAASTSETSVNFYRTTRRKSPEDSHLNIRSREKLKSHMFIYFFMSKELFIANLFLQNRQSNEHSTSKCLNV
jgi:hypothetical protein